MRIITAGRPLGPWKGYGRIMLLRNGCLCVALTEMFYSAVVFSASLGALSATYFGYDDLLNVRNKNNLWWQCFSYAFQGGCHVTSFAIGLVALAAHLVRTLWLCKIYILGIVIVHWVSLGGLSVSFQRVPVYNILIPVTLVRCYHIWVMIAYYLEIEMYPEGFPPPPRPPPPKTPKLTTPIPTRPSSLHYVGDG